MKKFYQSDEALVLLEEEMNRCKGRGYSIFEDLIYLLREIIQNFSTQSYPEMIHGGINKEGFFVFTDDYHEEFFEFRDDDDFFEKEVVVKFCSIEDKPQNFASHVPFARADYKKLLNNYVSINVKDNTVQIFIDVEGIRKLDV